MLPRNVALVSAAFSRPERLFLWLVPRTRLHDAFRLSRLIRIHVDLYANNDHKDSQYCVDVSSSSGNICIMEPHIEELDETGTITAHYVASSSNGNTRIDRIVRLADT